MAPRPMMKTMPVPATSMAVLVVATLLCCGSMVAPAEGRALLNIGKLIDHLKGHCPPPPPSVSDPVPYTPTDPYYTPPSVSEPSPVSLSPPYYAPPSPVDPPPVYASPPDGGY